MLQLTITELAASAFQHMPAMLHSQLLLILPRPAAAGCYNQTYLLISDQVNHWHAMEVELHTRGLHSVQNSMSSAS
jgi:hypothetical protein